jgi:hypothetical protein
MFKEFYFEKCAERDNFDGTTRMTIIERGDLHYDEIQLWDDEILSICFTVYGRGPDGLSRALIDTDSEQDAKELTDYFNGLVGYKKSVIEAVGSHGPVKPENVDELSGNYEA